MSQYEYKLICSRDPLCFANSHLWSHRNGSVFKMYLWISVFSRKKRFEIESICYKIDSTSRLFKDSCTPPSNITWVNLKLKFLKINCLCFLHFWLLGQDVAIFWFWRTQFRGFFTPFFVVNVILSHSHSLSLHHPLWACNLYQLFIFLSNSKWKV